MINFLQELLGTAMFYGILFAVGHLIAVIIGDPK